MWNEYTLGCDHYRNYFILYAPSASVQWEWTLSIKRRVPLGGSGERSLVPPSVAGKKPCTCISNGGAEEADLDVYK